RKGGADCPGQRIAICASAARQRHRQLHQGDAASAREDRARRKSRAGPDAAWALGRGLRSHRNRIPMTATAEETATPKPVTATAKFNPYIGVLGVFLGAATSQINAKLLSTGLADLRGTLGLGFDEASWIPTALNMGMMFTGVFAAFLGATYGIRRVLLLSGAV